MFGDDISKVKSYIEVCSTGCLNIIVTQCCSCYRTEIGSRTLGTASFCTTIAT